MPKIAIALVLTAVTLGLGGCHPQQPADVVATVNGHPILRAEVDKVYEAQMGDDPPPEKPSPEQADSLRLSLLHQLIDEEILLQRAAKMNVTATPEEVDAKFAEMRAPAVDEAQFLQRLADRHTTPDGLKRDIRRSLTLEKLFNKEINSKITVSDSDIASYYALHKSEFNNLHARDHIAQIVVTTTPSQRPANLQGSKATSDGDARKKIQALRNRIDSGEDFGALAMNFSENPQNSSNGGDMGLIDETELQKTPVVYAAISRLKPGQVTDIIPFPDQEDPKKVGGYLIFQLISREPAGQHDVSEPQVQQRIRNGLMDVRSQLLKGAYYEMLRDQAKVENFFAESVFKSDAK